MTWCSWIARTLPAAMMAKHTLSGDHSLHQRNFPCLMPPVMPPPYHACDRCMTRCPHFSLSSSHHLPPPSTQLSVVSVPANTPRCRLLYATSPAPEHPACIPNHCCFFCTCLHICSRCGCHNFHTYILAPLSVVCEMNFFLPLRCPEPPAFSI
jgi:hypothetical protein